MKNSKTKKMILNAILLGIGMILHQVFPALAGGITPDITLVMLFCILIINKDDYKTALIAGILTGIFSAMTTKFPMGQVPNLVDKFVTANVMFLLMKSMYLLPVVKKLEEKGNQFMILILSVVGTLVSGTIFLGSAYFLVGLPAGFGILFATVVLPAVVINAIAGVVIFNIIQVSLKRSSYQIG